MSRSCVCVLPDSDTARHTRIQPKLEATEGGAQLLIGELGSGLAGQLFPGLRRAILQGGGGAGLRGGGLLYMGATVFCVGYLQHLHTQLLLRLNVFCVGYLQYLHTQLLLCLDCPSSSPFN